MKFNSLLKKENLDAVLITTPANVSYLTNFTGSNGQVLFFKNRKIFLTDSRYKEQAKYEIKKTFEIVIYKKFKESLKELIENNIAKKIGFESKHLTYNEYDELNSFIDNIELIPLKDIVENIRIKKRKSEITKIKKAVKIAENSLKNIMDKIFGNNLTEKEFADLLEYEMKKNGAETNSFPTIVASGERSSVIHGTASNKRLDLSSAVLIDFGAKYQGYCSDKTITLILGKNRNDIKKVFNIVKNAKNYAIDKIRPGITAKKLDKIARDYIEKKGFGKYFAHSLGHGVGLDIHEKPTISYLSEDIIEEDMVFTIEPGIYIEGEFGVRLEDMVYVKKDGAELLTTLSENF